MNQSKADMLRENDPNHVPLQLASRAAFRKGTARYCDHINEVDAGCWVGGVVGLKSIWGPGAAGRRWRSWTSCR